MAAGSAINSSPIKDTARTPCVPLRMNQASDRIFSYFERRFGGTTSTAANRAHKTRRLFPRKSDN